MTTTAAGIRTAARQQLRDALLDAVRTTVVASGWSRVRMGAVAAEVGVSRQTLHAEFGTKDALGQALVLRETERFLKGVQEALDAHPGDLGAGVRAAASYTLLRAGGDPLLREVLTGGTEDSLLPLLTSRSGPTLDASSVALRSYVAEHFPEHAPERVDEVVDSLVRLVLSHLVIPVDPPEVVADRLARLVLAALAA